MPPVLRTCLPLVIAAALCLPGIDADAQQQSLAIAGAFYLPSVAADAQQQSQATAKPAAPPKPKHGPTPPPIACPNRLSGLSAGQTESFNFWLGKQGPAEQVKVAFSCKLDRGRIVVGLQYGEKTDKDQAPPRQTIHVLDLALDPPPSKLLREQPVEAPVVIVRPGGGMSLVFGETAIERGINVRAWRAIDVVTGKVQTLFSIAIETTGLGCVAARGGGIERFFISAEAALVDVGDNGPYGIEITHEDNDCKAGKTEKRVDTFVAVPDGFEEFK